jgi:hypothetical protein
VLGIVFARENRLSAFEHGRGAREVAERYLPCCSDSGWITRQPDTMFVAGIVSRWPTIRPYRTGHTSSINPHRLPEPESARENGGRRKFLPEMFHALDPEDSDVSPFPITIPSVRPSAAS